ncbi:MAG: FAD-binding monooxygenase [Symbiobacteriaceae bacterium]|nr:FAD-binding monooxygenase [Symbiobacteriaceae bacterium]
MLQTDVLIVGAGPAGATAALNLAPLRRVLLVDRQAEVKSRIGESLVPGARRLLTDMGLWESFVAEGHEPWYGNIAVWGGAEPQETDFLRDPDGHGWHLDRARFETWLRWVAVERGAGLLAPAVVESLAFDGRRWQVALSTSHGPLALSAGLVIDAGGRSAPIARKLGVAQQALDRLVCAWVYGQDRPGARRGMTYIEAVEDGWWYTAPLPGGRRVLAFHTDADLPAAAVVRERGDLVRRAAAVRELAAILADAGFVPESAVATTAAHSAVLAPPAGPGWLAAGDAATGFDPLSSQGLHNALFTGLAAAEAADRYLSGDAGALPTYAGVIQGIVAAYERHRAQWYGTETRWPAAPFWRRRQAAAHAR